MRIINKIELCKEDVEIKLKIQFMNSFDIIYYQQFDKKVKENLKILIE